MDFWTIKAIFKTPFSIGAVGNQIYVLVEDQKPILPYPQLIRFFIVAEIIRKDEWFKVDKHERNDIRFYNLLSIISIILIAAQS